MLTDNRLKQLIAKSEKSKVDFKATLILNGHGKQEFAKDVSSIANTSGNTGYLIIGVNNNRKVIGINQNSIKEEQLQNIIQQHCDPFVVVNYYEKKINGKILGIIEILGSLRRPHQLKETGAFHIRRGSTTALMTTQEITNAIIKKVQIEKGKGSEYEKLTKQLRGKTIHQDIINILKKQDFVYKKEKLFVPDEYGGGVNLTLSIFENKKQKIRICLDIFLADLDEWYSQRYWREMKQWWRKQKKSSWLIMSLLVNTGTNNKKFFHQWHDQYTIYDDLDSRTKYHGIGEFDEDFNFSQHRFEISNGRPKFLLQKINSKEDLDTRFSLIFQYLKEHKQIMDNARKLNSLGIVP